MSSISSGSGDSGIAVNSLGSSFVFHQPKTNAVASPATAPNKMLNGTEYPKKKKQNRKNNQALNPFPVESFDEEPLLPCVISLRLASRWQIGSECFRLITEV